MIGSILFLVFCLAIVVFLVVWVTPPPPPKDSEDE